MQISINDKRKTENTDNIQIQKSDTEFLNNSDVSFSEILQGKISDSQINISAVKNLPDIDFNYDSLNIDFNDALFFINLTHDEQFIVQSSKNGDFQNLVKTELTQNVFTQKNVEVTNQITALIEKTLKTQRPVRISFDNNISVILKIDKQGKVSAEFIPGSIEAENYLMKNISSLKQRFDEQNLAYSSLTYRQNNRQQGKNRNQQKGEA